MASEPKTKAEQLLTQLKNNPLLATLIVLGTIVIGVSAFTDAARNLVGVFTPASRPAINGQWVAEVTYDWPNAKYQETFSFQGANGEIYGTASFLGVKRGIVEGKVNKQKVQFVTKTREVIGDQPARETTHNYRGELAGNELRLFMQTSGGYSTHVPVEFTARRVPDSDD